MNKTWEQIKAYAISFKTWAIRKYNCKIRRQHPLKMFRKERTKFQVLAGEFKDETFIVTCEHCMIAKEGKLISIRGEEAILEDINTGGYMMVDADDVRPLPGKLKSVK